MWSSGTRAEVRERGDPPAERLECERRRRRVAAGRGIDTEEDRLAVALAVGGHADHVALAVGAELERQRLAEPEALRRLQRALGHRRRAARELMQQHRRVDLHADHGAVGREVGGRAHAARRRAPGAGRGRRSSRPWSCRPRGPARRPRAAAPRSPFSATASENRDPRSPWGKEGPIAVARPLSGSSAYRRALEPTATTPRAARPSATIRSPGARPLGRFGVVSEYGACVVKRHEAAALGDADEPLGGGRLAGEDQEGGDERSSDERAARGRSEGGAEHGDVNRCREGRLRILPIRTLEVCLCPRSLRRFETGSRGRSPSRRRPRRRRGRRSRPASTR